MAEELLRQAAVAEEERTQLTMKITRMEEARGALEAKIVALQQQGQDEGTLLYSWVRRTKTRSQVITTLLAPVVKVNITQADRDLPACPDPSNESEEEKEETTPDMKKRRRLTPVRRTTKKVQQPDVKHARYHHQH